MTLKKICIRLKNGHLIRYSYWDENVKEYVTIHVCYKESKYIVHSYIFIGNETWIEESYTDQQTVEFDDFDVLIQYLTTRFPGIDLAYKK